MARPVGAATRDARGSSGSLPLAYRTVLLAVPQYDCPQVFVALEAAGATVRVIADLAALRREVSLLGLGVLVVADTAPAGDGCGRAVRAGEAGSRGRTGPSGERCRTGGAADCRG